MDYKPQCVNEIQTTMPKTHRHAFYDLQLKAFRRIRHHFSIQRFLYDQWILKLIGYNFHFLNFTTIISFDDDLNAFKIRNNA